MSNPKNPIESRLAAGSRAAVIAAALTATSGVAVSVAAQTSRPSREPAPVVEEVEGSGEGSGDTVELRPDVQPLYGVINTVGGTGDFRREP